MEQTIASGYISADGHVVEPRELWTSRIEKRFRDRAPRFESRPGGPVEWAIEEAQRVAQQGLRSVSIPATVPDRPYFLPEYEPLWAALQEIGLPVTVHVGTGKIPLFEQFTRTSMLAAMGVDVVEAKIGMLLRTMAELIWGGVPQRYPQLRFVLVEGGIGWITAQLRFMDH
jgi:uncharacterized protein